jgi:20S proteasome alpha/beta subunit
MILQVYPHGSTDTLPFATMGSGSLAAMAVFETRFKEGMTVSLSFLMSYLLLNVH